MNANDYVRGYDEHGDEIDELERLIKDGKLQSRLNELASHWEEVMRLCEKYGLINFCYGGAATLCTHKAYLEANSPKDVADRLRTCSVDI